MSVIVPACRQEFVDSKLSLDIHFVVLPTLNPEWRNCPQLGGRFPICHGDPLCFGEFDLHLLDVDCRHPLVIVLLFAELGQDVGLLSL